MASNVRLALVHDWLVGMRGGEKCLEAFCRRYPQATLYTLLRRRGALAPAIERMHIHTSFLQRLPGVTAYYRWLLPVLPAAVESLRLAPEIDIVLSFSHAVAKGVRPPPGVPHLCYCFTPMRYAWHMREHYLRGARTVASAAWQAVQRRVLDRLCRWDRATAERVTQFVAISHTVARRISECYGRSSQVIYPPVDTDYYTPSQTAREDFYLCVSALVPYKRLDLAIEACRLLQRRLIIIGSGPERKRLRRLAGPQTLFLGWQPDAVIRDHYRRCRALLFPGLEDFGIVPVEAQACGTPVIAYGEGGAAETVLPADETRRGTGRFFPHQTAQALAEAMAWFESHAGQFDAAMARRQAERFSTPRFVRELEACLLACSAGRPARAA
jgi:glycosyltransferase involved in cell wall biosynthesis